MFNVLPNILKEEVTREYRIRRWVVILCHILFVQGAFLIFILPTIVSSIYKEKDVATDLRYMTESIGTKNTTMIGQIVSDTNTKLSIINTKLQYPDIISVIDHVLQHKTSAIHVTNIMYSAVGTTTAQIVVEGIADTRNDLVSFVKNLEASAYFNSVELPVSNLAKEKKIEFTVNVTKQ